jgi:aspartate racemase
MTAEIAIGLVGGLGPGATIHYYERLTAAFIERGATPRFMISHADFRYVLARITETALDDLADYLASHIESLARAGAGFAAIGAVAPHLCASQLRARITLPFVDLIDCVRAELLRRRVRRVAVLGTRFVMQSAMYGRLHEFEVIQLPQDALEFVHANYMKIASAGSVARSGANIGGLRKIAESLIARQGVEIIVLAGTELSLVFNEMDCGFPALDCARAHIHAILMRAFGEGP